MDSILQISGLLTEEGTGEGRASPLMTKIRKFDPILFNVPPTFVPRQKDGFSSLSFMPPQSLPLSRTTYQKKGILIAFRQILPTILTATCIFRSTIMTFPKTFLELDHLIHYRQCKAVSKMNSCLCFEFLLTFGSFIIIFMENSVSCISHLVKAVPSFNFALYPLYWVQTVDCPPFRRNLVGNP